MLKKFLLLSFVCVLALSGVACGGGGGAEEEVSVVEYNPSLEKALAEERAGRELTGKQKRILEDAREAGIIE